MKLEVKGREGAIKRHECLNMINGANFFLQPASWQLNLFREVRS